MCILKWIPVTLLGVLVLAVSLSRADETKVEPIQQWTGSVENEGLQKIAPQTLTTNESLGILWKAWGVKGKVPRVDFSHSLVIVSTTRGSRIKPSFRVDEKGNLKVLALATRDLRPGFRYVLTEVPHEGVVTVNDKPLPPHVGHFGPEIIPTGVPYKADKKLTGKLHLGGSKTMGHMVYLWAEGFQQFHPKMQFEILSEGSETALAELKKNNRAIMGVSRKVSPKELRGWEKAVGKKIQLFPVCEDDIALIVHPKNPIRQLSPDQYQLLFSYDKEEPLTWGQLGLKGKWKERKVVLHGRNKNSGTRRFLLGLAGVRKDGGKTAKEHDSYSQIVEAVAKDPNAIGYSRAVNVRDSVKSVGVGPFEGGKVKPYLRRTCHLVVVVPEGKELPPSVKQFLLFTYRLEGQGLLFQDGFHLLNREVQTKQLERLGVDDIK